MRTLAFVVTLVCAIRLDASDPAFEAMLDELLHGKVAQVTPEQLAAKPGQYLLLDSRNRDEYEISHIEGARWIGFNNFDVGDFDDIDRETPIVVYCSVGKRSEIIGEKLEKVGFKNVANLRGGIFQWANESRPLVDADGPTKNVHPYSRKWGKWLEPHVPKKK